MRWVTTTCWLALVVKSTVPSSVVTDGDDHKQQKAGGFADKVEATVAAYLDVLTNLRRETLPTKESSPTAAARNSSESDLRRLLLSGEVNPWVKQFFHPADEESESRFTSLLTSFAHFGGELASTITSRISNARKGDEAALDDTHNAEHGEIATQMGEATVAAGAAAGPDGGADETVEAVARIRRLLLADSSGNLPAAQLSSDDLSITETKQILLVAYENPEELAASEETTAAGQPSEASSSARRKTALSTLIIDFMNSIVTAPFLESGERGRQIVATTLGVETDVSSVLGGLGYDVVSGEFLLDEDVDAHNSSGESNDIFTSPSAQKSIRKLQRDAVVVDVLRTIDARPQLRRLGSEDASVVTTAIGPLAAAQYLPDLHFDLMEVVGSTVDTFKEALMQNPNVKLVEPDVIIQFDVLPQGDLLQDVVSSVESVGDGFQNLFDRAKGIGKEIASGIADLVPGGSMLFNGIFGGGNLRHLDATDELTGASTKKLIPNDTYFDRQWSLESIRAAEAWKLISEKYPLKKSVVVALLDSGTSFDHKDLANSFWTNSDDSCGNGIDEDADGYVDDCQGWDFVDQDADPTDMHGHGTTSSGLIAAGGNNLRGIAPICWNCQILPIRVLNENNQGRLSAHVAGLNYALAKGARISNNSYGAPGANFGALQEAVSRAQQKGMLFVAAAGNQGKDNDNPSDAVVPASWPLDNIISVASINSDNRLSSFSNWGHQTVDLAAPGESVLGTQLGGVYQFQSGTSFASPQVVAVAASIWGAFPQLSMSQVKTAILSGTRPLDALNGKTVTGGTLDMVLALEAAAKLNKTLSGKQETSDVPSDIGEEALISTRAPTANSTTTTSTTKTTTTKNTKPMNTTSSPSADHSNKSSAACHDCPNEALCLTTAAIGQGEFIDCLCPNGQVWDGRSSCIDLPLPSTGACAKNGPCAANSQCKQSDTAVGSKFFPSGGAISCVCRDGYIHAADTNTLCIPSVLGPKFSVNDFIELINLAVGA